MAARHYINNKDLLACIVDYKRRVREAQEQRRNSLPEMPDYAGKCILMLCEKMGTRYNFSGYSYRQDMVNAAVLNCVQAFDNFNPEKTNNPFGYFSRIAWRAMIRTIWDERVQSYVKHKNFQRLGLTDEQYEGHEDYSDSHSSSGGATASAQNGQQISDDIISRFEESLAKKKLKAKGVEVEPDAPEVEAAAGTRQESDDRMVSDLAAMGFDVGHAPDDYDFPEEE